VGGVRQIAPWAAVGATQAERRSALRTRLAVVADLVQRVEVNALAAARDAPSQDGAGEGVRTLDINLGKVALYQLSYARIDGVAAGPRDTATLPQAADGAMWWLAPKPLVFSNETASGRW
jgi:hypothetical protein